MHIAIITNLDNGIGLQVDYELLRDLLVKHGHEVIGVHWQDKNPPKGFDLAIFLETLPAHMMDIAARNWAFPNPEWLRPDGERALRKHFEKVFAKTSEAQRMLSKKLFGVHYVGFLTRDKLDASIPRKRTFLHIGGNGGYRNTPQVLEAWRSARYWDGIPAEDAPLVIVSNNVDFKFEETPGVTFHKRLPSEEITRLQNECLFHLYPSATEGFGHALHEALGVGAVLLTTNAPPMYEVSVAYKIPMSGSTEIHNANLFEVRPTAIRETVNRALAEYKGTEMSSTARAEFERSNLDFEEAFLPHLEEKPFSQQFAICIHGNHKVSFCTEQELVWTFRDLGFKVIQTQENEDTTEEILDTCLKNNVRLFIYVHTHGWITPGTMDMGELIQKFKLHRIKTVSFHLDRYRGLNIGDGRESRVGTHPFWHTDYVFTADGGNQDWFKMLCVNHFWLPPGVVKKWCVKGTPRPELAVDVAFVGARGYHPEYPFRETLIKFLEDTYGNRFRLFSGYREQSLNDLYASVKVVVGDSCFGGSDYYWSDRVPETTGRGGFLIHPASKGLSIPGLVTYEPGNLQQLAERIDYYLEHQEEREKLRDAAQAWVRENETYTNRAQTILRAVGLFAPQTKDDVVNVIWYKGRGYTDQTFYENLFAQMKVQHHMGFGPDSGVVILPARHCLDDIPKIQAELDRMKWVLLFVGGDEESLFPVDAFKHPNMFVWYMSPLRGKHRDTARFIANGSQPKLLAAKEQHKNTAKIRDWFFAGQVTHSRRQLCTEQLRKMQGGKLIETAGFMQGIPVEDYYQFMAESRVIPCPSGPQELSTARIFEALELGCVPIVDGDVPVHTEPGYWEWFFGEETPFPVIYDWKDLPRLMQETLARFSELQPKCAEWWERYKQNFREAIEYDIETLRRNAQ